MTEALEIAGFQVVECRARFLPYTTKSRLPQWAFLVRLYLRLPPAQWLLGKQMLVVAERPRRNDPPTEIDFIIPVYNEGSNIASALAELYATVTRPNGC